MPTTTDLLSTILGSDDTQGQFEINLEKTQLSNVWSTLSQALSQTKKFLVSGNTLHITCRYKPRCSLQYNNSLIALKAKAH